MWTVDSIRIFVQKYDEGAKQIIARLQPLGGGTVLHLFGWEDETYKLSAFVVGENNKNLLIGYSQDQAVHVLTTPYTTLSGLYVNNVDASLTSFICQTLDPLQDETAPVYRVDIELYHA